MAKANYIYFGRGEYALTDLNIAKCIQACKNFQEPDHKWEWKMVDVLGIKDDGTRGDRYHQILRDLSTSDDPQVVLLLEEMKKCPEGVTSTRVRVDRGKLGPRGSISEAKEKEMLAAAKALGIPESEVQARIDKMRAEAEAKKASAGFDALLKLGYTKEQITALVEAKKASNE